MRSTGYSLAGYDDQLVLPPGRTCGLRRAGPTRSLHHSGGGVGSRSLEELGAGKLLAAPGLQRPLDVLPGEVPLTLPGFESRIPAELWPAGEGVAPKRLAEFTSRRIGSYKDNRDFPGVEGTSAGFSPYLAAGVDVGEAVPCRRPSGKRRKDRR